MLLLYGQRIDTHLGYGRINYYYYSYYLTDSSLDAPRYDSFTVFFLNGRTRNFALTIYSPYLPVGVRMNLRLTKRQQGAQMSLRWADRTSYIRRPESDFQ